MKKTILSILAITLMAVTLSAKKKADNVVVVDFANGNPLTAVQGTTPEKVTLDDPAYGIVIPSKYCKTTEQAVALGYVNWPNPEKNEEGWYLPYSKQSFQSNGKAYEFIIGTSPNKGRKAGLQYSAKRGAISSMKLVFSFPEVGGMIPSGIKIHTVNNGNYVNERFVFRVSKGKMGGKNEIARTNPAEAGSDTVLSANFEDVQPGEKVFVYTHASFNVAKIEFIYSPVGKAKKNTKKK